MPTLTPHTSLETEFNRQIENLLAKGYPKAAGISETELLKLIEPLRGKLHELTIPERDIEQGMLPFVIVVKNELVSIEKAMTLIERQGKRGIVNLFPIEPEQFRPIDEVTLPKTQTYLLTDIDRGKETLNVTPENAYAIIRKQNRFPLTIEEGIAIITHYPEFLIKNNCFSLLASRYTDKRVPAIWLSEGKPKLGWCWAGNPHTWLGSASCRRRL